MRTLVVGAGALGGFYGACLTRAGRDITFFVRPRRAEQLVRKGLRVVSEQGDFAVPAAVVQAGELHGPFDLVLVAVKSYSLDEAMDRFAPAVGPSTMILPILNGMSHLETLTGRFGAGRVLGGLAQISAAQDSEGRIIHFGGTEIVFGETAGGLSDRTSRLAALFEGSGFAARASDEILREMWAKWVQVGTGAGMTCLMRGSIGDIVAAPGGRETILQFFGECCAIATAAGYPPTPAFVESRRTMFTKEGSSLKWSMLRDIERGSATEGEHLIGGLVARANALGVAAPMLKLAHVHIGAYEAGRALATAAS
jgi:2-dehydropantoate 2-reductase